LTADEPASAHCGKCSRCIAACPTGAIVAPYRLDARRCISYLTIELKGSIPVELRPLIGDRVFGCDTCLEVCPWNRFARPAITARELPALVEMLAWTEQQFADFFRGTAVYRLKRARFLRNVCVVLGNVGNETALPTLERARNDGEALVREHAMWAINKLAERR
jgi:epoxyqueuosine reductase